MYSSTKSGGGGRMIRRKLLGAFFGFILLFSAVIPRLDFAQGAFYMELAKNGRIYVFNDPKAYQEFLDTGDIEKKITRIGEGPNGETMVFDSDNAIHLYNFKHDRPAEIIIKPEEKKPVMEFSWKDGKTTFKTDKAELNWSNRIQFRFTNEDEVRSGVPPYEIGDSRNSFRIRRAKTKLDGWFYTKDLTYELQLNWADISNVLEDANIQYDLTKGKKAFMVKGGQFKVPFGRQELTSSGSQEFVDRALVTNEFARGRDLGVQIWGTPMVGKIDWRFGVFNGAPRSVTADNNTTTQYDARLSFQPFGDVKYSEADFESTDKPLLALEVEYESTTLVRDTILLTEQERKTLGADVDFKYKGLFVFVQAWPWRELRAIDPATGNKGPKVQSPGYLYQAGYLIGKSRKFEIAGRYGTWDPSDLVSGNDRTEVRGAVSYYFNKHNLKWQADYGQVEDKLTDTKLNEFRVQVQWIF
jgi:phosphate-selective porin OprO/OprP